MRKRVLVGASALVVGVATLASVYGAEQPPTPEQPSAASLTSPASPAAGPLVVRPGADLGDTIAALKAQVARVPNDHPSWASLGLAYVQQAHITANSDLYRDAEAALARSLAVNDADNFLARAGLSALAAARHDFTLALTEAEKGLSINPSSPVLYGVSSDALVQLGRYDEADAAVAKMASIRPDTASYARQSYLRELRGDVEGARRAMRDALALAPTAADRAFALFHLGELAFDSGDANGALALYREALVAAPDDVDALAGKAKAQAALGQYLTAIDDYRRALARAPEPSIAVELAELLELLGRRGEAQAQHEFVTAMARLFQANGVQPDASMVLYEADYGDPARALALASRAVAERPFVLMHDAHAWALHRNGRHAEALAIARETLRLGYRSALLHYHVGMIEHALGNEANARAELAEALAINPSFHPLAASTARQILDG